MLKLVSPTFADLMTPNMEIGKFPDGDSHVRILDFEKYKGREVTVYHRLYPKQNTGLIVLLLILDTLKAVGAKPSVLVPYLPYARQDKIKLNGEASSAKAVCGLLAEAGCEKLYTFDCHFLNSEGDHVFGGLNIHNISMAKALVNHAQQFFNEPFEVVVPDAGAAYLVKDMGGKHFNKVREEYKDGHIGYRDIESLTCDFETNGKNFLVLDDMISTGSTMLKALEKLKECGAKKLCAGTTHGLFLFNCLDKLRKLTDCVISTDTIPTAQSTVSIKDLLP